MISRAVYNLIKTAAPAQDVYELMAPQGEAAPFIVYNKTTESRWRHINGPDGMAQDTFQIDVYAGTSNQADEIANIIENTFDGYRGLVYYGSDSPQDSIRIGGISMQTGFSLLDQTDEPFLYRVSRDYLITYERS